MAVWAEGYHREEKGRVFTCKKVAVHWKYLMSKMQVIHLIFRVF